MATHEYWLLILGLFTLVGARLMAKIRQAALHQDDKTAEMSVTVNRLIGIGMIGLWIMMRLVD